MARIDRHLSLHWYPGRIRACKKFSSHYRRWLRRDLCAHGRGRVFASVRVHTCARYNIDEGINETVRRGGTLDGETAIHSEYVTCTRCNCMWNFCRSCSCGYLLLRVCSLWFTCNGGIDRLGRWIIEWTFCVRVVRTSLCRCLCCTKSIARERERERETRLDSESFREFPHFRWIRSFNFEI